MAATCCYIRKILKTTHNQLKALFSQFTDEKIVDLAALPKTTSGNDAYKITTASHSYVLRTLARPNSANVHQEYLLQQALLSAGIVTPLYLKAKDGHNIARLDGITGTLSSLVDGERPQTVTLDLINNLGITIAKLQTALAICTVTFNESQWFEPANIIRQLNTYSGPFRQQINSIIQKSSIFSSLPKANVHGDLHTQNLFAMDDTVSVVFDLETVSYSPRIFDIARTYLTLVKGTPHHPNDILRTLLAGFDSQATAPLTKQEMTTLNAAISYVGAVTALSIFNNGNPASSERYVQLAIHHNKL